MVVIILFIASCILILLFSQLIAAKLFRQLEEKRFLHKWIFTALTFIITTVILLAIDLLVFVSAIGVQC